MKTFPLIAVALLLVSSLGVCRANLGESEAQCIARYGAESDIRTDMGYRQVGDKAASFTVKTAGGSLDVRVTFLRGLSCHESISNSDSSHGLPEKQMKALLDSQSSGFTWEKGKTVYRTGGDETSGIENWTRSDGATAKFFISGKASSEELSGELELSTKEYTVAQRFYDKENGSN
jgi:hypothetical protein